MKKRYQALSRFSILQAMESWVGPGNEAIPNQYNDICETHNVSLCCMHSTVRLHNIY